MITPENIKLAKPVLKEDLTTETEPIADKTKKSEEELQKEATEEAGEIDGSRDVDDIVLGNNYYHVRNAARARGIPYEEILGLAWENAQEAAETFDSVKGDFQKRIVNSIYQTALEYDKERAMQSNRETAAGSDIDAVTKKNTSHYSDVYDKMNKDISKLLGKKFKERKQTFDLSTKGLT